jgi:hypothetical protein
MRSITLVLLLLLLAASNTYAQSVPGTGIHLYPLKWQKPGYGSPDDQYLKDSSLYLFHDSNCKSMKVTPVYLYALKEDTATGYRIRKRKAAPPVMARKPLLVIHGNVMYDVYYQSNTDTPYLEKELYQHTLQTSLDITVKDKYPLHLNFSTSKSNSSLIRDITGVNFQYTNRDFRNAIISKAKDYDAGKLKQLQELAAMKAKLDEKWQELYQLKGKLMEPSAVQRMVEERERALYGRAKDTVAGFYTLHKWPVLPKVDGTVLKDSAMNRLANLQQQQKKRLEKLDSLQQEVSRLEKLYQKKEQQYGIKKAYLMDVLLKSRNNKELTDNLESLHLPDSVLPKGYRTLLALRSVGLGRTMVDYSELTAKNISITGVQAEFNPSYYVAFATGAVDYRFRDFIVNDNRTRQYLSIVRVGAGMREGNNVIFSYYTGKKQLYNFNTDPGNGNIVTPDYHIMGMSLEARWQLDKHNYIIGEAAKSSLPWNARGNGKESVMGSMLGFDDHSNEAYAVSAFSFIPLTATRLSGMFKLMGANFQSFSLYTSGSRQTAWQLRGDQPFFRQQLTLSLGIRKNIYNSLLENTGYQSNTVFKSIQATFRRKHWPTVSLGYFPSTQLMKLGEGRFIEHLFYTLSGTASHFYQYRNTSMNIVFSGTKFYNRQADSNFVYFNSTNLMVNQTVFLDRFTLNGGLSSATNQDYALYGADGNVQYRVTKWLDVGGGVKYNYQTFYEMKQTGYTANVRVDIPKVGEVRLMADKGFVPGVNKQLVPNKTGRLTYTKIF